MYSLISRHSIAITEGLKITPPLAIATEDADQALDYVREHPVDVGSLMLILEDRPDAIA